MRGMAEPTEAELKAFTTVESVCAWVGLAGDARDILTQGLGCADADSYRPIGGMPEADFDAVIGALQVQSAAPPSIHGKFRQLHQMLLRALFQPPCRPHSMPFRTGFVVVLKIVKKRILKLSVT